MLNEFLDAHRTELVTRCRDKQRQRWPGSAEGGIPEDGVPILIDQLVELLSGATANGAIERSAARYGTELERRGCSIEHLVHAYGDLCQAVTELAQSLDAPISVDDFRRFNGCLDIAIAEAVGEFGRRRSLSEADRGTDTLNERLGSLAHELRNMLNTALLAYTALKDGRVALGGATGAVLEKSLDGLRVLIDGALADVRVSSGLSPKREQTPLAMLLDEVRLAAQLEADARGRRFTCAIAPDLSVVADRQMLSSALANLLQNAFKFTRAGGAVSMTVRVVDAHVLIVIADECGGLPDGASEALFRPFEQRGNDRSGMGLGLTISRRSVEANGGTLSVRDRPGVGCVFTIALPQTA